MKLTMSCQSKYIQDFIKKLQASGKTPGIGEFNSCYHFLEFVIKLKNLYKEQLA